MWLIIAVCILISSAMFFESFGFILRILGNSIKSPSLGYSLHVQLATISRIGTLISFPLLAYLVESNTPIEDILFIPMIVYIIVLILISYFAKNMSLSLRFGVMVFRFLYYISARKYIEISEGNIDDMYNKGKGDISRSREFKRIVLFGTIAFALVSGSFMFSAIVATNFREYRATILQSAPLMSSIGTLLSVMYFDPTISKVIDDSGDQIQMINAVWRSRVQGSLVALLVFLTLNIIVWYQ